MTNNSKKKSKIIITLPNSVDKRAIEASEKVFGNLMPEKGNINRKPGKRRK
jgi:hypothetical protein